MDTFQGREAELGQIQAWVQDATVRLIGIAALGGYGKTFLVAKALTQVEGVSLPLWISFNKPYAFATFGRWLLQQFGQTVDEKVPDETLRLAVVEQLSQQRCLLVMDNLETLLNEQGQWQEAVYGDFFQRWLSRGSSQSTLLLTSRAGFFLPDNQREMCRWHSLEGLATDAGIELLKAKGIRGAETDLKAFADLVGGQPLSLNLAAGWLLNPKKNVAPDVTYVLKQDDFSRFEQIVGEHNGDSDASVGRILATSVEQLTPTLKTLWQDLSVYWGSFDLAAAQAMMARATLDDLSELARRSLLQEQQVEGAVTQEEKWQFEFLPLIQSFAQQQAGDLTVAHTQAFAYYRSVEQPEPWQSLKDIIAYLDAFDHLCELGQYTQAFHEIAPCDRFLDLQGHSWLRLELYRQLVRAWVQELWQLEPGEDVEVLLVAVRKLGEVSLSQGEYSQGINYFQWFLELADEVHNQRYKQNALKSLGVAYLLKDNYGEAEHYLQQSLLLAQESGDRAAEGFALYSLGDVYLHQGNHREAIDCFQQQRIIAQEIHDPHLEGLAIGLLGDIYFSLGHYEEAIRYLQHKRIIAQEIDDRVLEQQALDKLGIVYFSLGNYKELINDFQRQLTLNQESGDRISEGWTLHGLGRVYLGEGNYGQAADYLQRSLTIAQETDDKLGEASTCFSLGGTQEKLKEPLQALQAYEKARLLYQQMGLAKGVQRCDQAISRLSTRQRGWLERLVSWLLRVVHRLWGKMKDRR